MEFDLYKELENYHPSDKHEQESLEKIKKFLKTNDNCFSRTNLKGHLTAGAIVIDKDENILLNHHKQLNMWLFFGGHSDGDTNSLRVAKREVMEESGITEIDDLGGKILEVDVHMIPDCIEKNEPAHYHYHINFLFIAKNTNFKMSDESTGIQWVTIEEARNMMIAKDKDRVLNKVDEIYKNIKRKEG